MRFYKLLILFAFTFLVAGNVSAQIEGDDPISVDSSIVRLNIGVVDKSGNPIKNLSKQDFTLYEDGVEQNILTFEPTARPFSLALILDMSGSTISFRQNIRMSALRFIDALAPEDRVAVIEFYDKVNLLNDFPNLK